MANAFSLRIAALSLFIAGISASQRYRMVEVKGPGDRLQDNQRRFLEFCTLHKMPVSVCPVRGR